MARLKLKICEYCKKPIPHLYFNKRGCPAKYHKECAYIVKQIQMQKCLLKYRLNNKEHIKEIFKIYMKTYRKLKKEVKNVS